MSLLHDPAVPTGSATDVKFDATHFLPPASIAPDPGGADDPASARCRVLVLSPQPFYEDRGTPIAVRQLLHALVELGCTADLLSYPIGSTPEIPGVRYIRGGNPLRFRSVPVGFSLRKLVLDAALVVSFVRQLRRERYDAIHAIEEGAFPAVIAARWLGIPLIYDMPSSLPEQLADHPVLGLKPIQPLLRACERWLLRRVDRVICSAGLAEKVRAIAPETDVREWSFFAEPRVDVSAEGAAELRAAIGIADGQRVVLYAGNFASYQGIDLLLRGAARVCARRDDVDFVLVGGYSAEQDEVLREVGDLGISERVHVLPRTTRPEIARMMQIADILISPRCFGGNLPLKIFDYLSAGRPIVATDIPTHRTILEETTAVLVSPTATGIAEGVEQLLGDEARGVSMCAAARALANSRFGWKAFVDGVRELYTSALGSDRIPVPFVAVRFTAVAAGPQPTKARPVASSLASGTTGF
jgi:glycosyltransferase involved in cell wall biosynthesis